MLHRVPSHPSRPTVRRTPLFLALWVALAGLGSPPAVVRAEGSAAGDDAIEAQARAGQALLEAGKLDEAIHTLEAADKKARKADRTCLRCQTGLARAYNASGAHKDALDSAEAVLALSDDDSIVGFAYNEKGLALMGLAGTKTDTPNTDKLSEAETAFRKAVERTDADIAHFNLGVALLRQAKDEQGVAELEALLERSPNFADARAARELIANPLRARKNLVPDLDLVTLAGEHLATGELRGRVVLLDFWGVWCAPCRESVPSLRSLARKMADDPFVLISVSNDRDRAKLQDFVTEHDMTWPQVWDEDLSIVGRFGVRAFPSYFLVGDDGEIVYSGHGWSRRTESELRTQVVRALKRAKKADD